MKAVRILIVEDDYSASCYLRDILLDIGYEIVDIVSSGELAIELVSKFDIDIILMDIELEGKLDGIATVNYINKIANLHVIYITGLKDKRTFHRAKATFPDFFLSKPFNKYQLLDVMDQIMDSKEKTIEGDFSKENFFVKTKGVYKKFNINSIRYVQANGSSTDIFFKNQKPFKITLSKNLKNTLKQLSAERILRINRSYAINIDDIESIENWQVKLYDMKETITVQENFRHDFDRLIKKL